MRHALLQEPGSYALSADLVALENQVDAEGEAFRALRTHIMARHVGEGRRALAVCAATTGVGCSFVAANLAVALSQIGVKTLLIDANLRAPGIEQYFRPAGSLPGLQQCLSSRSASFGDWIQPEVLPDLSILFSGGRASNPQELLASERFTDLMNFSLRDYDMTVLDTPPASSCSDAHRVSTVAGYSVVVARRNASLVNDVKILVSQLELNHARVIGTVMTEG